MARLRVAKSSFLVKHLKDYIQYSGSENWINWYAQIANYKAIRTAKMLLEYKNKSSKLLDVGTGAGITLSVVGQVFQNSTGIDIDKKAISAAKNLFREVGTKTDIKFYEGKTLPFKDNSFDIVTCIEVIEHVESPDKLLKEIKRILKPDGILHITTANKWWPYEPHYKLLLLSYLPKKLADYYVKLSGRGESYDNIKLPSYGGFKKMVARHFLVDDITLPMIEHYKKHGFDKERGMKVVIVGKLLESLRNIETLPLLSLISKLIKYILIHVSLGWLFIARPKKQYFYGE